MFQIIITNVLPQLSKQNAMVSIANEVRKHLANCLDLHYVEINISEKNGLHWSDSVHLSDYGLKKYIETLEQKITQVIKDQCTFLLRQKGFGNYIYLRVIDMHFQVVLLLGNVASFGQVQTHFNVVCS